MPSLYESVHSVNATAAQMVDSLMVSVKCNTQVPRKPKVFRSESAVLGPGNGVDLQLGEHVIT